MSRIDDRTAIIANPYANHTNIGTGSGVATLFYDNFTTVTANNLPDATKWGIAYGSPDMDPTKGGMWYQHSPNNIFVDGSQRLNFVVTVNPGSPQTAGYPTTVPTSETPTSGGYISARISTFVEPSGPPNAPGLLVADWTQTRTGFVPFLATWGTVTFVARMFPAQGLWPALWMYGGATKHWPECGEIDVFENFGTGASGVFQTLTRGFGNVIGPQFVGDYIGCDWDVFTGQVGACITPSAVNINDGAFHTYVCSISSDFNTITMTCDGTAYGNTPITRSAWLAAASASGFTQATWPFGANNPLGIVMNVAVGNTGNTDSGNVGLPSSGLVLPYTAMQVSSVTFTQP